MTSERKYREDEVSEIFALATEAGSTNLPASVDQEGLTLGELQDVGREVGLAPERVAQAAATLDALPETLPAQTWLGAPVTAGRIAHLPRAATDQEWQFLVAELRETFGAKGEVISRGNIREWSNGNLHAVLEQTEAGHRIRLGTRKGNVSEFAAMGGVGFVMALIMLIAMVSKGKLGMELLMPAMFAVMGSAAIAANVLRLPRWAEERERQMEHIANRARALLAAPPVDDEANT